MTADRPHAPAACPPDDVLVGYVQGLLAEPESDRVAGHLAGCPACDGRVSEVMRATRDGLDDWLRECLGSRSQATADLRRAPPPACDGHFSVATPPASKSPTTRARPAPAPMPTRVGKYAVGGLLGKGGMGVVYLAYQPPLDRPVAVKVLKDGGHPDAQPRFRTEAEAVARVDHPNVVKLYDYSDDDPGGPYLVMEYVPGGSLAKWVKDHGRPDPRAAAGLAADLASAVAAAHAQGVLHRDLKPSNVLLTADGVPKVTDFGLAKLADADGTGLTAADAVLGTPAYMAPEQAFGRPDLVDARADVYALGVILYELLAGVRAFPGDHPLSLIDKVKRSAFVRPSRVAAGVPAGLEAVCLKCMARDPAARYPTADAVAADLRRWLAGDRTAAHTQRRRALARRLAAGAAFLGSVAAGFAMPAAGPGPVPPRYVRELKAGRPVVLVDGTGRPGWVSVPVGRAACDTFTHDDVFGVEASELALVELLPDPVVGHYRFSARVRHAAGGANRTSRVGLFAGRQTCTSGPAEFHCVATLGLNDRAPAHLPPFPVAPSGRPMPVRTTNSADLYLRLLPGDASRPKWGCDGAVAHGPDFAPDPAARRWHDLSLTVGPGGVHATWDGKPFGWGREPLAAALADMTGRLRAADIGLPPAARPELTFRPQGGLGVFVNHGAVLVRSATVTPLGD